MRGSFLSCSIFVCQELTVNKIEVAIKSTTVIRVIIIIIKANFHFKILTNLHAVKPVLRDCCPERQPVLTDHLLLAEGPTGTFHYNQTCSQKPYFKANGVVFQDSFRCIKRIPTT